MTRKRIIIVALFLLASLVRITAENVRGPMAGILDLDGNDTVTTSIESLVAVRLPDPSPLIQGLKLTLTGDENLAIYRNSFALYFYKNLNEDPTMEQNTYRGSQALMRFLAFSDPVHFLIPLTDNHTMSPDRASFLVTDRDSSGDFPYLLTILPITKGIPDSIYDRMVTFSLTPVYFDRGLVRLTIRDEQGQDIREGISISVDGKNFSWPSESFILSSGLHTMVIRSAQGAEESLQFSLIPGQTLLLDHVLQTRYPLLTIDTIEGMEVYLNNRPLSQEEISRAIEIPPGSHVIRFQLGDFQLSREFTAEMQDTIRISMNPEILIELR